MKDSTTPKLDLTRYQNVISRVNEDQLAEREEGRSTAIAALILEGGLTFRPGETYHVAVFVCNVEEMMRYRNTFADLRRESVPFKDVYFPGGISLNKQTFNILIQDWDGHTRISVRFFVLPFLREDHFRGVQFHNYFVDISEDNQYISRLFSAIPVVQSRLRENITR